MNRNLKNSMKTILLFGVMLAVSACQQGAKGLKAAYQAEVSKTLGSFVRGISTPYQRKSTGRGVLDYNQSGWPTVWPTGYGGGDPFGQSYGGVGQLYGGTLVRPDPVARAMDCDAISELGEASENFQFNEQDYDLMLSNLAKCLDALIVERNPIMTYGNRNMGNYNLNQMGYATGYGMPVAYGGWGQQQNNQLQQFLYRGYY
jgi:hypothetical protein